MSSHWILHSRQVFILAFSSNPLISCGLVVNQGVFSDEKEDVIINKMIMTKETEQETVGLQVAPPTSQEESSKEKNPLGKCVDCFYLN